MAKEECSTLGLRVRIQCFTREQWQVLRNSVPCLLAHMLYMYREASVLCVWQLGFTVATPFLIPILPFAEAVTQLRTKHFHLNCGYSFFIILALSIFIKSGVPITLMGIWRTATCEVSVPRFQIPQDLLSRWSIYAKYSPPITRWRT